MMARTRNVYRVTFPNKKGERLTFKVNAASAKTAISRGLMGVRLPESFTVRVELVAKDATWQELERKEAEQVAA